MTRVKRSFFWIFICIALFVAIFPIYWMIVTALRPDGSVYDTSLISWPPQFGTFGRVFDNHAIEVWLRNSLIVAGGTTIYSLFVAVPAGYSLSRFQSRLGQGSAFAILTAKTLPPALLVIPMFLVFQRIGLSNSLWSLILANTSFAVPFCVWMLKGFFDTISDSLIEAARVDGASRMRIIHSIVLPLSAPGLVAAGLFAFIRGWNDFIFALTLAGPNRQTLPPGLVNTYLGEVRTVWPELMAACLVVSVPVIVVFIALQRYLVSGLTAGAVKG
jgi:multiple sugar transport system permease protein